MRRLKPASAVFFLALAAAAPAADRPAPGRDPGQAIDEEYTKKIKEYTTEPFFLSPLVDYLPASRTVPTPRAVLKDIAGAPASSPLRRQGGTGHGHPHPPGADGSDGLGNPRARRR